MGDGKALLGEELVIRPVLEKYEVQLVVFVTMAKNNTISTFIDKYILILLL